jgi:hypothetical protein
MGFFDKLFGGGDKEEPTSPAVETKDDVQPSVEEVQPVEDTSEVIAGQGPDDVEGHDDDGGHEEVDTGEPEEEIDEGPEIPKQ